MKRKIYSETPTSKPCCSNEEKLWNIAWDKWLKNGLDIYNTDQKIKINDADINWTNNTLKNYKTAIDKANKDYSNAKAETEKFQMLSIINEGKNDALFYYYNSMYKESNLKTYNSIIYKERLEKNIIIHKNNLKNFEIEKITLNYIQKNNNILNEILFKSNKDAASVYLKCKKGCLFPVHVNLILILNLKSLCKEIKQKIKTLNQKKISFNSKLLDLKYGLNSLHILNINKNFCNSKIKIKIDFLEELDKLRSDLYSDLYLEPTKLFLSLYNEAKINLAFYKKEINTIDAEIKISKEKIKKIPEKKIKLKDKTSKLFEELKICLLNSFQV